MLSESPAERSGQIEVLQPLVGRPIRITITDGTHRERIFRTTGVLESLADSGIEAFVLEPMGFDQEMTITVEGLTHGEVLWFHTGMLIRKGQTLRLRYPSQVFTSERRQMTRVDIEIPVHVSGLGEIPVAAFIRDISAGGASLRSPVPAVSGQAISLVFSLGSGFYFQNLLAEVVRCSEASESVYSIGVRFRDGAFQQVELEEWIHRRMGSVSSGSPA